MESKRRLAAVMFTDIIGYSALVQNDESQALEVKSIYKDSSDRLIAEYDGKIINYYGDGMVSIFESTVSAVRCACQLQKIFIENSIPVRVGIHEGDILVMDSDVVGDAVNIASRIESLGVEGSVLISSKVNLCAANAFQTKTTTTVECFIF